MAAKHLALLLAAVLALVPLSGFPAKSQGILPYLQKPAASQLEQQEPSPPERDGPRPPHQYVPPDGLVPDAETAAKIGEIILDRFFGPANYSGRANLEKQPSPTLEDGVWIVKRIPSPGDFDGRGEVHISKKDGTISFFLQM
jgi:hypothetical protein